MSRQELSTVHADTIKADAALRTLYPTQVLDRDSYGPDGLAVLSTYPLVDQGKAFLTPGFNKGPAMIWARLDIGGGETLLVTNVHPMPGSLTVHFGIVPIPTGFDATLRDIENREARRLVTALERPNEVVLLLGDFNITEREAAYSDLTAGLQNAVAIAEPGLALSWGLEPFMARGIPLLRLRIDYLLSNERLAPHTVATDCTARGSDHCKLIGAWEIIPRR